jgi:hypothetical protein
MRDCLEKVKKKVIAEESSKTRKAREKLKKQLDAFEKKITPQALERKTIEIHRWIARHASHRIVLRTKAISLFDENQNAAKLSEKVAGIAENLKQEILKLSATKPENFWNKDGQKKKVVHQPLQDL